ncbi:MAG: hypothetical protein L6R39_001178 [Caloplaca ligustica]|nr:MAG: hypothetical protein L6R39_001178 [Caloplaca ligustica]
MASNRPYPQGPNGNFGQAVAVGLGAGAIGVTAMTITNKLEQLVTGRPNSYVPGHTSGNLLGVSQRSRTPDGLNHFHHWSMGLITAPVRAIMAYNGMTGPYASFIFMALRLTADEVLEYNAGVVPPPWTLPILDQTVDLLHKFVFSFVSGYVCDRMIRGVRYFGSDA